MTRPAAEAYCEWRPSRMQELYGSVRRAGWAGSWFPESEVHFTYRGRTALRRLCDIMGLAGSEVLVPAYNCGAETEPYIDGGAKIVPYRVDYGAQADIEDIRRCISERTKALHVTYYFGFPQPIDEIRGLCLKNDIFLIEDCALALFSGFKGKKLGSRGDAAIFSLPKSLPLTDGGALVINNPRLRTSWQKRHVPLMRTARGAISLSTAALLRRLSVSDGLHAVFLSLHSRRVAKELASMPAVPETDVLPDVARWMHYSEDFRDRALSGLSEHLLKAVDEEEVVRLRRRNYMLLASLLPDRPDLKPLYADLPPDVCPLGLPVLCNDRERLYKSLLASGIWSAIWWPGFPRNMDWGPFSAARFLKNHVLLLPVHQGLREKDMEQIARALAAGIEDPT